MNKNLEREILNMIFVEEKYVIQDSEEPDFILQDKNFTEIKFGVEITEFFKNEANARLNKIKDYIDKILYPDNTKGKPHKGDLRKLKVDNMQLLDENGKAQGGVKCIVQKPLVKEEIDIKLSNCIKGKEKKLNKYKEKVKENYLIIYDQERVLYGEDNFKIYEYIYGDCLNNIAIRSKFREIYLITESSGRKTYSGLISMKFMNMFSSALSFANKFGNSLEEKFEYSFNILYNYGFRFKWGILNVEKNFFMDMKKEIQNKIDLKKTYIVLYHDCLIKFSAFNTSDFCIIGRIQLPLGLSLEDTLGINLLNYIGNYNLFLKINDNYNTYVKQNEVRHYVNSEYVKGFAKVGDE